MEPPKASDLNDNESLKELEQRVAAATTKIDAVAQSTEEDKHRRGWPMISFAADLTFNLQEKPLPAGADLLKASQRPDDAPDDLLRPAHAGTQIPAEELLRAKA